MDNRQNTAQRLHAGAQQVFRAFAESHRKPSGPMKQVVVDQTHQGGYQYGGAQQQADINQRAFGADQVAGAGGADFQQLSQFLQEITQKVDMMRVFKVLKDNNFQLKPALEALLDELTNTAAQTNAQSQKMLQQSLAAAAADEAQYKAGIDPYAQPHVVAQSPLAAAAPQYEAPAVDMQNSYFMDAPVVNQARPTAPFKANFVSQYPNQKAEPSGRKKALLIGINYNGTKSQLNGCIEDVKRVKNMLTKVYGFLEQPRYMTVLTDAPEQDRRMYPSKSNIMNAIGWLTKGAQPGDVLFFHYSGHGSRKVDLSHTEIDGYDETILPLDYKTHGQITDDELNEALVSRLPSGVKLVCIMDCCHSGSGLDLPFYYDSENRKWKEEPFPKYAEADVVLISSCQDGETAADVRIPGWGCGGAVSLAFVTAIMAAADPHRVSYHELFARVAKFLQERQFGQLPQLSATQRFDINQTHFGFTEIVQNMNPFVGGHRRRNRR